MDIEHLVAFQADPKPFECLRCGRDHTTLLDAELCCHPSVQPGID
ncbi:hypothetical protein Q9R08_05125 [Microbacterium sp. QXD-8]|uniref:Uncharacterized protein n=1 Tax=Microbacterium psychrotolerans TaxID=3068321 RepID=A0ABU0YYF0_9MICO|nr:hypothetical protein [Microbacterium sp. QXD-8]MDQ7877355.1 hypothetical protein [Microbacterium sp. QXD-8]